MREHYLAVLNSIVEFSLALNVTYDKQLKQQVTNHHALKDLFNQITSYKYILRGMLNDANLS